LPIVSGDTVAHDLQGAESRLLHLVHREESLNRKTASLFKISVLKKEKQIKNAIAAEAEP
jgi:hypothetical protein